LFPLIPGINAVVTNFLLTFNMNYPRLQPGDLERKKNGPTAIIFIGKTFHGPELSELVSDLMSQHSVNAYGRRVMHLGI